MAKRILQFMLLAVIGLLVSSTAFGQASTSGTLTGTVTDSTGAVIAGADVSVKDLATGLVLSTKSGPEGNFTVSSLKPGDYIVTVTMQGFKKGEFRNVKIAVGGVYDLAAKLEVGQVESTVVVEAGAEVLETSSSTIGTTITGKAITQLPLASRDALDLAILMPGAATTGRARQTSFMGLPKGAINITYDGINSQDNVLKSNDGFFTIIRPKIDAVEEFSITTAGQGADQAAEGAVSIRFETKRGTNQYHGGAWWQHRNDFFNSNYYFNNEVAPGALGVPRQRQRLNQFGGKVGGPIWKDKIFFFVAMDNYRLPSSQSRTRTILGSSALTGNLLYGTGATVPVVPAGNTWTVCSAATPRVATGGAAGNGCTVNLFTLAAASGFPVATDPASLALLTAIESARAASGVSVNTPSAGTPWIDTITFNNPGNATRRFPDVRLDYNITKNIQVTGIYHYNYFISQPDFLNGLDATYPVAPFTKNQGSQISNRNELVAKVRWNLGANKSNEATAAVQSAPVSFFPDLALSNPAFYPAATNNLGSVNVRPAFPLITNPIPAYNTQGRNGALGQFTDTFSWTHGKHNFNFGGSYTGIFQRGFFANTRANTATLGLSLTANVDPANVMFNTSANFPGSSAAQRTAGASVYAMLTGRLSAYTGSVAVDENTRNFVAGGLNNQRVRQNEYGFFISDNWRFRSTLTINAGLRWDRQGAPYDPRNITFRPQGGYAGVFGQSGAGGFFTPGTLPGGITTFELNGDKPWYNADANNWSPSLGLAWTPSFDNKLWRKVFGGPSQSVFRASYAITYTREGTNNFSSIAFTNPGLTGTINAVASTPAAGPCPANSTASTSGTYPAGCMTLSNLIAGTGYLQSAALAPAAFPGNTPFQMSFFSTQSVNGFDANLRTPMVQNWSFGWQREITSNMVFEARYVANHGTGLWRQDNVNEVNVFENGFLQEFQAAQGNLAICRANQVACRTAAGSASATFASYANLGLAGQVNVPVLTAAYTGSSVGSQSASGNWSSATFITPLDNGAVGGFANILAASQTTACRLFGSTALQGALPTNPCATVAGTPLAGFKPVNFFVPNENAINGGAFRVFNGAQSTWNALTLEVRQRLAHGLQINANYTFSKALTNLFADSSVSFLNRTTNRNSDFDKGPSPWDLRHSFKMNFIYGLPFGPGHRLTSSHGWVNRLIDQWEFSGITRWQSGRVFLLTNTNSAGGNDNLSFNNFDPGVQLIGITPSQIQAQLSVRKTAQGQVFWFPASLIDSSGNANSNFIAPCTTAGKLCQRVYLYGPSFFRPDLNIQKTFRITERVNFQLRAEFLNAFNNANFFYPGSETTSVATVGIKNGAFGQVTNAYRDVSTTDDNGGRIIQFVFRVNF
ncbi:MAG: TonB-dependent receptor [Acidobacteria bacterium]|nr:TonB-dependent receptor [Acidobacteriota bacterium]